jgi:hemerythrin superfamily protein
MDAIDLLQTDHRTVEQLFTRYEATTDQATKAREDLARNIIKELSIHAVIEEQVFYPAVRLTVPDEEDDVLEALEEHHVVKWTLSELEKLSPSDERFHPKVTVLIEAVRHHVEEEEGEMFPAVRDALSARELDDLGDRLDAAKRGAPTHPHPRAPDSPPGNMVAGAVSSVMDRARDLGRDAIESARDAIGDARDAGEEAMQDARRTANRSARQTAKTAKSATRSAQQSASDARKSASKSAKKATRSAKKTAKASGRKASGTAKKASGTAKKASGTAKKSARKAAGTAKKSGRKATRTAKNATGTAKKSGRKAAGSTKKSGRKATSSAKRSGRKATASKKSAR